MTSKDIYGRQTPPPHPGEILREEILPHYSLDCAGLARHLKANATAVAELLDGVRDIDRDLAVRLGAAFGQGAHFWLGLQMQHDLWHARQTEVDVRPIRPLMGGEPRPTATVEAYSPSTSPAAF